MVLPGATLTADMKPSRPGPTGIRFSDEEKRMISELAEREHRTFGGYIRHIVLTHVQKEHAKEKAKK